MIQNKVYLVSVHLYHNNKHIWYDYDNLNDAMHGFKLSVKNVFFWGNTLDTESVKLYLVLPDEGVIKLLKEWREAYDLLVNRKEER